MASPFPGMDPYLEHPAFWRDFHVEFLANLRAQLNERLPLPYSAQIEEAVRLVELDPPGAKDTVSDVAIDRGPGPMQERPGGAAAATLEPVTLQIPEVEEVHDHWVEVRHRGGQDLVTIVELLSPSNKAQEREIYKAKREALLRQRVHLVEIDLLVAGKRLPMRQPLPPAHYYALASRAERRPDTDVYHWSVRHPLPTIPCPLLAADGDVYVDLAAVFRESYRRAAYDRLIDYATPPGVPLGRDDLAWATEIARGGVRS